jgi:hypothetical protein
VYQTEGTYSVSLVATGPDYMVTKTESNYIQVGGATIEVSFSQPGISFGAMKAGVDSTGSSTVNVDVTGGTAWAVAASAGNGGFMKAGTIGLASPFQLSKDGTNYQAMTSPFANFVTGQAGVDGSGTASVKQAIASTDAPGDYTITVTFTGGFA